MQTPLKLLLHVLLAFPLDAIKRSLVRKDLVAEPAFGLGTDVCQRQAHRTDKVYGTDISYHIGLILFDL